VNVLARRDLTVAQIAGAGARRISVGGALAWAALDAFVSAAERIRDGGDFSALGGPARVTGHLGD
jgi:2-methylisocitrate lyase-like PEP mutase family enzyme